jgi:uncharacterized protein (DUF2236 family)
MVNVAELVNDRLSTVRQSLGDALRERVAGPNANERVLEIIEASGERWFADDRPIRLVHADASMFIGGLRALLIQTLHPLAMAGVAQHSDYRNDPWGRLQRTADFLAVTTFGPADEAQRTIDRIRHVHSFVQGTAADGRPYSANDPHLLEWVHVAEVDSFLTAYQRFGTRPLNQRDRDRYIHDMAVIAGKLGVHTPPESERELRERLRRFIPELRSTPESRDAVRYLTLTPPLTFPANGAYFALVSATVATLPAWTRPLLRLPLLPLTERLALRPLGIGVTNAFRWVTAPNSPFADERRRYDDAQRVEILDRA